MSEFNLTSNISSIKQALIEAVPNGLEMIGILAERYAKARCPVGTPESTGKQGYRGGTLRNSITYVVEGNQLHLGSNVEYAPYVELGTGPFFEAPPAWVQNLAPRGSGSGHGYVRPRPYLRPAIIDHLDEYKRIMGDVLSKV